MRPHPSGLPSRARALDRLYRPRWISLAGRIPFANDEVDAMVPDALRIRSLEAADHALWMRLWRGYQAFYEVDIAEAVSAVTWGRLLDPAEPMAGALALRGETAVGLVHWIFHRSTWTTGNYAYLQDLFVSDGVRGAGVGRTLIAHVEGVARSAGCSRVYWLTQETNAAARALYDKVADRSGFIQYRKAL